MDRGGDGERAERERVRREMRDREERRAYVRRAHAPALRLLQDPDPGRLLESDELELLIRVAGEQGWEPWERRDEARPEPYRGTGARHHEEHVARNGEWPRDFSPREYDASIRRVIGARDTEIWAGYYRDPRAPGAPEDPRVVFHSPTLPGERGPNGREYAVVSYSIREARWKTAFQTDDDAGEFFGRRIWRGARQL